MRRLIAAAAAIAFLAPAAARSWAVDIGASKLGFEAWMSGQTIAGTFTDWKADIAFDTADLAAAKAKVTIALTSAATGNSTRDKALPSATWFDVGGSSFTPTPAAGPGEAVFETTGFRQTGAGTYEADGTLSMRGVSRPVTLPFALQIDSAKAHMTSRLSIDRTLWGVGQGDYAGDTPVATKVDVVIDLTATGQ